MAVKIIKWRRICRIMKKLVLAILTFILAFSAIPAPSFAVDNSFSEKYVYQEGQFSDVTDSDWYASGVKTAYEYGIMQGNGDNFGASNPLTIAETITMASRLHSLYNRGTDSFEESSPWYQTYIDYAAENKICTESFLDYSQFATRAFFVTILRNSLSSDILTSINEVEVNAIPDVPSDLTNAAAIYDFYRAGILTGTDSTGKFQPSDSINRAAVATIIARIVEPSLRQTINLKVIEVTMYAPDGRTNVVPQSKVEANKKVGWYEKPVIILYASDGRTQVFYEDQVDAQLAVGWYKYQEEALNLATSTQLKSIVDEYQKFLETEAEASAICLTAIQLAKESTSRAVQAVYLIVGYQEAQTTEKSAVGNLEKAISLCGNYANTQTVKGYMTDLVNTYSPLINFDISAKTIADYITLRNDSSDAENLIMDNIMAEIDIWLQSINK